MFVEPGLTRGMQGNHRQAKSVLSFNGFKYNICINYMIYGLTNDDNTTA